MFTHFGVVVFLIIQFNFNFAYKDPVLIPKFHEDYTYSEEHDAFFKLLPQNLSWFDAFTECTKDHSRLVFPRTTDEALYIRQLLSTPDAECKISVWVGASKINLDGVFKTVEGVEISNTYFQALENESIGAVEDECVVMKSDQKLYKKSCFSKRRGICRKIPPADPCPTLCIAPGYSSDPDRKSCYKVHTDLKIWMDAKKACEREGSHLLVLNSLREAKYLKILLNDSRTETNNTDTKHLVSVGFNDLDREGVYVTVEGQPLNETGYSSWYTHEPSGKEGKIEGAKDEDCGSMWRSKALLNDISCDTPLAFVCERDIHLNVWNLFN